MTVLTAPAAAGFCPPGQGMYQDMGILPGDDIDCTARGDMACLFCHVSMRLLCARLRNVARAFMTPDSCAVYTRLVPQGCQSLGQRKPSDLVSVSGSYKI